MLSCWNSEPIKRPTFDHLAVLLGDILQDVTKSVRSVDIEFYF